MARYRCPKCRSDRVEVTVQCWAELDQSDPDNLQTDIDTSDQEWDGDSSMRCRACGQIRLVRDFEQAGDPDPTAEDDQCPTCVVCGSPLIVKVNGAIHHILFEADGDRDEDIDVVMDADHEPRLPEYP